MSPELVHNLFLGGAATLAVMSLVHIWRALDFLRRAVRTDGRITRHTTEVTEQSRGDGQGFETWRLAFPHVEFSVADGSRVEFRSRLQVFIPKSLDPGSIVTVVYDPKSPAKTAEIAGPRAWLAVWVRAFGFGVGAFQLLYFAARGGTHF